MPISLDKENNYNDIFLKQSYLDFKRQARKLARCKKSLIWEKNKKEVLEEGEIVKKENGKEEQEFITVNIDTLEPVIGDKKKFRGSKYITSKDEVSRIAFIWARVLNREITSKRIQLSPSDFSDLATFTTLKDTFSCLSWKYNNDVKTNYEVASHFALAISLSIEKQQEKHDRIKKEKEAQELRKKDEEKSFALMSGSVESSESCASRDAEKSKEKEGKAPLPIMSKVESKRCTMLVKGIYSVAVLAMSIFVMMLYKNNRQN